MSWTPQQKAFCVLEFAITESQVTDRVYRTLPESLDDLEARIRHEFEILPQAMIDHAIDGYVHRLEKCLEVNGQSVE